MVDFPEAESPVNQIVRPGWRRRVERSVWVREEACQVMLLWSDLVGGWGGEGEACLRCHVFGDFCELFLWAEYWLEPRGGVIFGGFDVILGGGNGAIWGHSGVVF